LLKTDGVENAGAGDVKNSLGQIIGTHNGYENFTIGQRRGLGIAGGVPLYVTNINAKNRTVTLGTKNELDSMGLVASAANWFVDVNETFDALVKIRYAHKPVSAKIVIKDKNSFEVHFAAPISAITPGQAAVVYKEDIMLGGGWIESAF
jgi:tRNA-uridine 2-sulfurtransferase